MTIKIHKSPTVDEFFCGSTGAEKNSRIQIRVGNKTLNREKMVLLQTLYSPNSQLQLQ
uniref:Uncharacterized protein n=1 Tax=Parascaris univalens TaxID=6257 RepID=A0A915BZC0_PARUN